MRVQLPKRLVGEFGFTLVELMVALVIGSLVMATIIGVFSRSNRLYTKQNVAAGLQQEVRSALEIMARQIRLAGYDPKRTKNFGFKHATATRLHFTADLDENGLLDPTPSYPNCENQTFRFSNANNSLQMICGEGTGSQNVQTLLGNSDVRVTAVDFDYRNNLNQSTTFIPDIRGVVVTIVAQAPAGRDGMITRKYSTWIDFRNAAPNAAL